MPLWLFELSFLPEGTCSSVVTCLEATSSSPKLGLLQNIAQPTAARRISPLATVNNCFMGMRIPHVSEIEISQLEQLISSSVSQNISLSKLVIKTYSSPNQYIHIRMASKAESKYPTATPHCHAIHAHHRSEARICCC